MDGPDQSTVSFVAADAAVAAAEFDGAAAWLEAAPTGPLPPFAAEVWVLDAAFEHVLLVRHRWRGWVPPGGAVEPGESPRCAASREMSEETGLNARLLARPAAVSVRSFRTGWAPTLCLSYGAVADRSLRLSAERGQPAAWVPLARDWESVFPDDRRKIRWYAGLLSGCGV